MKTKQGVSGVAVVAFALAGMLAIVMIAWGWQWITAPIRGELDAREQTQGDGTYRIAAYEEFYDRCASIQSLEDQIERMEADTSLPESQRSANVLALRNQRDNLIRQYNADARKEDTRANFRASDLPHQLDPEGETSCTV